VHPDDPRYKSAIGKRLKAPFHDRTIPVIADAILVDPKFGTGAVKVTPAHDFADFETGKRHGLAEVNILNADGTLNAEGARFAGMERQAARKAVKRALEELGLARGSKPHQLAIGRCSRSGDVLEPIISRQWYVKTAPLAAPAIEAVQSGRTTFTPEEWTKTYMHWMTNIQDWCISRQLWWGHQIPAWNCGACGEATVARETPSACAHCKRTDALTQDPDVLDTWFSSALWPFSTLGWPERTKALQTFYPTSVMETGYDILFFWVARMMMMGIHFMKDVPFRRVLLHGMVCDETGEKMSKVKGNVIDPLDMVHGATLQTHRRARLAARGRARTGPEAVPQVVPAGLGDEGWLPRVRRGRGAVLPGDQSAAGQADQPPTPPGRARTELREQDLERDAVRAALPGAAAGDDRRGRPARRRTLAGGPLDPLAARARRAGGQPGYRRVPPGRVHRGGAALLLGRAV
jgi:valyl-tRNA synthetase